MGHTSPPSMSLCLSSRPALLEKVLERKASDKKSTKGWGGHLSTAPSLQRSRSEIGSHCPGPCLPFSEDICVWLLYSPSYFSSSLPLPHNTRILHHPPQLSINSGLLLSDEVFTPGLQRRTEVIGLLNGFWSQGSGLHLIQLFTICGMLGWIS